MRSGKSGVVALTEDWVDRYDLPVRIAAKLAVDPSDCLPRVQARRWDRVLCLRGEQIAYGPPASTLTTGVLEATYGAEIVATGKYSLVYVVGQAISRAVGFFMIPLYTRYIAPSHYGAMELIEILYGAFQMIMLSLPSLGGNFTHASSFGTRVSFPKLRGFACQSEVQFSPVVPS